MADHSPVSAAVHGEHPQTPPALSTPHRSRIGHIREAGRPPVMGLCLQVTLLTPVSTDGARGGDATALGDLLRPSGRRRPACTPSGTGTGGGEDILGVPVVGDLDSVAEVARCRKHRVVSVAQTPGWTSKRLHNLAWDLEGTGAELVVDPGLMEIAGPRLHVAAVDGLPLLRLTEPAFTGVPRVIKATVDRLVAVHRCCCSPR